jgi:hypothetical protein
MVSPSEVDEDKVCMAVEVTELLIKQCDELNARFTELEVKLMAMNKKNANPEVEVLTLGVSRTWRMLRWKLLLSLMDLPLMLGHMSIPSNTCLCLI